MRDCLFFKQEDDKFKLPLKIRNPRIGLKRFWKRAKPRPNVKVVMRLMSLVKMVKNLLKRERVDVVLSSQN